MKPATQDTIAALRMNADPRRWRHAAVLLEVVLALVLFVAAAAVIASAINASLESVERQKLNLHAANLAVTVLSELQLGQRSAESGGPEPFRAPFEQWTWQLALTTREDRSVDADNLTLVEVVVRHENPSIVHRLAQVLKLEKPAPMSRSGGNAL